MATFVDIIFRERFPDGSKGERYLEDLTREVNRFDREQKQAFVSGRNNVDKYEDMVRDAANETAQLERRTSRARREINRMGSQGTRSTRTLDQNMRRLESTSGRIGGNFGALARRVGLLFAAFQSARGIGTVAQLGIDAEQTQVSFETFLGSAEKAEQVIEDLNRFSTVTPFRPDEVIQAGKALLAFGIEAENLEPTLKSIGDISAATGKNFNELAVIYGKARTQGTLFAEDINQLTEAGVPIIAEFAKQFGVTEGEVKKLGSEGNITFANLEQAFRDLTGEGGRFFNLMEKQSQTVGGRISTLQGNFEALLREIGENGSPVLGEFVDNLNDIVQSIDVDAFFEFFRPITDTLAPALDRLLDAFGDLIDAVFGFNNEGERAEGILNALDTVFNLFIDTITIITNGVSFLTENLSDLVKWFKETRESGSLVGEVFDLISSSIEIAFNSLQKLWGFIREQFIDTSAELNNELARQQEKMRMANEEMLKSAEALEKVSEETEKATQKTTVNRKEVEKLQKAYAKLNDELNKRATEARLDLIGDPVERIREEERIALEELDNFREELEASAKKLGIEPDFEQEFEDIAASIRQESDQAVQAALESGRDIRNAFQRQIEQIFGADSGELNFEGPAITVNPLENIFEAQTESRVRELAKENIAKPFIEGAGDFEEDTLLDKFERLADKIKDTLKIDGEDLADLGQAAGQAFNSVFEALEANNQRRITLSEQYIAQLDREIDEIEDKLQIELDRQQEGTANSVAGLEAELREKNELRRKAEEERLELERKAARIRLRQEALQVASNIVLSVTKVLASESSKGVIGIATAAAGIASIFALVAKARAQAAEFSVPELRKGKKFEGERLQGRSHENRGIPLVVGDKRYEAEGGEWLIGSEPSRRHNSFLKKLNEGRYKDIDLEEMVEAGLVYRDQPTMNYSLSELPKVSDPLPGMLNSAKEAEEKAQIVRIETEKTIMRDSFESALSKYLSAQTNDLKRAIRTAPNYVSTPDGTIKEILPSEQGFKPKQIRNVT